jgi:hypothetical protein
LLAFARGDADFDARAWRPLPLPRPFILGACSASSHLSPGPFVPRAATARRFGSARCCSPCPACA